MKSCISSCKILLQPDDEIPAKWMHFCAQGQKFCSAALLALQASEILPQSILHFRVFPLQKRAARTQNMRRAAGMQEKICENRPGSCIWGESENRRCDQQRGIFVLGKPFFRRNTLCIARENGAAQRGKARCLGVLTVFGCIPIRLCHIHLRRRLRSSGADRRAKRRPGR